MILSPTFQHCKSAVFPQNCSADITKEHSMHHQFLSIHSSFGNHQKLQCPNIIHIKSNNIVGIALVWKWPTGFNKGSFEIRWYSYQRCSPKQPDLILWFCQMDNRCKNYFWKVRLSEKLRRLKSGPSEKQGRLTRRGWVRKWDLFGKLVRVKRPSEKKKEDIYHYQRILAYRAPCGANKVTEYIKHWLCTICHVNDLPVWTSLLKFFHILAKLIRKTYVGSRGTETELQQTLPNFSRSTLACNSSIEYGAKHSGGTETALYLWKMSKQFQAKEAEWNNVKFEIQNWNQDGEIENPNISFPLCVKSLIRMGYGFLISNWNTALKI